MYKASEKDVAN